MTFGRDLLSYGLLAKAEAVAKRDRAVFFLQSDADAQIAGCKRTLSRKVNHRAIGRGAEAILNVPHLVEDLRLEHQEHRSESHRAALPFTGRAIPL